MTREEAIFIIEHRDSIMDYCESKQLGEALDMAIAALKAEPCDRLKLDGMLEDAYEHGYQQARYDYEAQPCEDAIKRESVLNTLDTMDKALDENRTVEAYKELLKECYKELPRVTPKPMMGKWISDLQSYGYGKDDYHCSICGRSIHLCRPQEQLIDYPYCHCGAKMEGESE